MRCVGLLLMALLVSACGTASDNPAQSAARAVLAAGPLGGDRPSLEALQAAILQAVQQSGSTEPVLLVALPKRKAIASLVVAGVNDGAVTWLDNTGVSVVTRRGVVISTRGLGTDVMASDVSGTLGALRRGGSGYVRLQRVLDGEGHLHDRPLTCEAPRKGAQVIETCRGLAGTVTNSYEMRGGEVSKSRQWLGADIGYAEIARLQ